MTPPNDPLDALKWALDHSNEAWWVFGAIAAGIAWTSKRLRDWNRRNALSTGPPKAGAARWTPGTPSPSAPPAQAAAAPQPAAASAYTAATAYAGTTYAAQAAYAPPPAGAPSHGGPARKLHRDAPPAQRAAPAQRGVTPVARSVDVPVPTGAWTLAGAFGDPAHARTAIVIAEVLGRPVGLR